MKKELIKKEYEKLGIYTDMNKYQEALNTIVDALSDYVAYREFDSLPSENEIFGAMALLKKLVNKVDSFEWIPFEMKDGFILCQIKTEDGFLHDQIPNVGEKILVTDGKRVWEDTWIEYDDGYALDSNYDLDEVTAWIPFPEPYKENENE